MSERRFDNVWDAIEDMSEAAQDMQRRSALMTVLKRHIAGMSTVRAAEVLGVNELRVAELVRGEISGFGLEALTAMATAAGLPVDIQVRNAG